MSVQRLMTLATGKRGFTLLEVLVVLVVMGFLVTMVAPRLAGISQDSIQTIGDTGKSRGEQLVSAFYKMEDRYPGGLVNLVMADDTGRYQIPYADNENPEDGAEVIRFNHNNNHKFVIHYLNAAEARELIELGVGWLYNLNDYGDILDDPAVTAGDTVGRLGSVTHTGRTSNWANVTVVDEADQRPKMERVVPAAGVGVAMAVVGASSPTATDFIYVGAVRPPSAPRADSFGRIVFGLGSESELVTSGMADKAGITPIATTTDNFTWDGYYLLLPRLEATSERLKNAAAFNNVVTGGPARNLHAGFTNPANASYGKIVAVGYPAGTPLQPGQIVNGGGVLQPAVAGYARRVVDLFEPHPSWDSITNPTEGDLRWSLVFNKGSLP
ncbi:MAG: prepilin-type N-terminal cleavage/methylation domain-containing protein [Desulfobulbaceae bacterium]|nr:prepilin-type N-terminal cleavage/methylation domain-containing protein [Desulfobulbaceae bacterium]